MEIATLFFQLIHHEEIPNSLEESIDTSKLASLAPKLQAMLLSTHQSNIDMYQKSQSFQTLYNYCLPTQALSIESIKLLQYALLQTLKASQLKQLKPHILHLNAAEIISNQHARNLSNFCTQGSFQAQHAATEQKTLNLKTLSDELTQIQKKLYELQLNEKHYAKLQQIYTNTQNNKFSIGITGVLSAGKSTFLNALLGKEILGSSTIPETANLTILKYDSKECAEVFFWNTQEWNELKNAAKYDKSLQRFVLESEQIFGTRLNDYIANETKSETITLDKLSTYTSANHESKLCNLVKEVVLHTPLKFLQNGVEIVDTPGLDDPITKREEITKSYITQCDVLIHVMNASCVATQIDIDFILETLLEHNISRLLIVLTRIDLIGEKELAQSLEYTKTSLAAQLKKAQYEGDIDAIIERIDFIPVASFLGLLHKIGREQEALEKGFDYEKTGIMAVESYLDRMLLGENSLKQKDILYLAYRGFAKVVQQSQKELEMESLLLNASEQELESMIEKLKAQNAALAAQFETKKQDMQAQKEALQSFLDVMQKGTQKTIQKEQERMQGRILSEATYSYTNNTKLSRERIIEILESGLSDCFSDVSRDYKYKLTKKIAQMLLDEQSDVKQPQFNFHAPKEQIAQSIAMLQERIPNLVESHGKGKENELSLKLQEAFNESFVPFTQVILEKNNEIEAKFKDYFDAVLKLQEEALQLQITEQEEILQTTLEKRARSYTPEMRDSMQKKQKDLDRIAQELAYITQALK